MREAVRQEGTSQRVLRLRDGILGSRQLPRATADRALCRPVDAAGRSPRSCGGFIALRTEGGLQPHFAAMEPKQGAALLHAVVIAHGETLVANSVVACVLWLLMAAANRRARGDGSRIISAILFALGTEDLRRSFRDVNSTATLTVAVVIWLVGLAAIVLLFSKEAPNLFRGHRSSSAAGPNSGLDASVGGGAV